MKKLLPVLVILISLTFSLNCFAYENVIADDADLFSDYEETEIASAIELFSLEKDFSLAVVTTDYASGLSSEEFADNYLDDLIDTDGWQENSMLFLIDMDNRNVWISTCGDCVLAFSNSEIDSIIDSGYNSLVNGEYSDCILQMTDYARQAYTEIVDGEDFYIDEYGNIIGEQSGETVIINGQIVDGWHSSDSDSYENYYYESDYHSVGLSITDIIIYIIVGLAAGLISVFIVKNKYKNTGKGDEFNADDVLLNLMASNDSIVSRNVITTRIPKNNNRGGPRGGGFSGGGSSVHRSSAGRSHGGGGRSF